MSRTIRCRTRNARGFSLVEVLISLVVLAFGLLSLARAQGAAALTELEARQRTQAIALVQDMVDRINLNRKEAAEYVGEFHARPDAGCASHETRATRDMCEWQDLLAGTATQDGARFTGAPMAAFGCISSPTPNVYVVSIAWRGVVHSGAPRSACGEGDYGDETMRRAFSTVVQIATLDS
jgi:type IV pilus assembly protein PilV